MTDKKRMNLGWFAAKYLHCLRPFVEWQRGCFDGGRFIDGNLFVEPAAAGGVHIIAITPRTLAVIHDPDGRISRPCVLDIPEDAFTAARAPEPIAMNFEGQAYALPLPEWAQPGRVYVYDAGMHIVPQMRHPDWAEEIESFWPALYSRGASHRVHTVGVDYRLRDKTPPDWRKLLQKALDAPVWDHAHAIATAPALVALFEEIHLTLTRQDEETGRFWLRFAGTPDNPAATIVRIQNHPEFIGCVMPMKQAEPHDIPAHFFFPAPQEGETCQ